MDRPIVNTKKSFIFFVICSVLLTGFPATAVSEITAKSYRNQFLSPSLQQNYYKIAMQTTRFFERQQSDVNMLIESFRGSTTYAYDMFTRAFTYGKEGVLDAQAFTYDGAIAALALLVAGQPRKAERLLQVYRKEFYYVKVDDIGLFNSYRTDIPENRFGGLAPGVDGDRTHLGPTMWVAIAALQYTAVTGDRQFLSMAIDMASWARHLKRYTFPDGESGAVCMGYGWGPDWTQVFSTENNVDYYAVLSMLTRLYNQGDDTVKNLFNSKKFSLPVIEQEMKGLERWFREVAFDPARKTFYCGFNERGVDATAALDTISWTIAGIGPKKLDDMGINPFLLMSFAEKNFRVFNRIGEEKIEGFDFTNPAGRGSSLRLVWVEGTCFQTVTYQLMARYAAQLGLDGLENEYRAKARKYADEMEKVAQAAKLMEFSLPYTAKRPREKEIITTFNGEWEVPRGNKGQWVASSSSTAWRLFALAGFNPLAFDENAVRYRLFKDSTGR